MPHTHVGLQAFGIAKDIAHGGGCFQVALAILFHRRCENAEKGAQQAFVGF
jgi:hypothetical protein